MIDALIGGKVYGSPKQATSQKGVQYTRVLVRVASGSGDTVMCSAICFDKSTQAALLALAEGDSVTMAGSLTPKVYQDREGNWRPGLDMLAQAVLTPYHVRRKRSAMQAQPSGEADV